MDFVLAGLSYITCLVYLDDIIIFGRTFEEQLNRLEEVFRRIQSASTDDEQLSAPTDRLYPKAVRTVDLEPEVVHLMVRENFANDQCTDAELGRVVQLRLETDERPTNESIQTDSELTKKMVVKWDNLEVHNGLVYRRLDSPKPTMLQLLVPRCCVPEVLRLCHTGTVGGHFGVKRAMIQVQRRFYSATWKTDVRKYCKECSECSTYHRGKLSRSTRPTKPRLSRSTA